MNRREMLVGAGMAVGATALNATRQYPDPARPLRIVITGGHPGDPEYGCGGTIARLAALGHQVTLLYLNDGAWPPTPAKVRIAEARKASSILKATPLWAGQENGHAVVDNSHYAAFQKLLESQNPDAVFTHWPIDNHPDHRAIGNLTFEAWKQLKHPFALYYYEVSDGDDTLQFGVPTNYVDISGTEGIKKDACYAHASQQPDYFYPLQDTVAQFRGLQSGYKRAEAFIGQVERPYDIFSRTGLSRL